MSDRDSHPRGEMADHAERQACLTSTCEAKGLLEQRVLVAVAEDRDRFFQGFGTGKTIIYVE